MNLRPHPSRPALFLLFAALGSVVPAQERVPTPFSERVEVRLRSVLVVVTDKSGKQLRSSPKPADFEVRENGRIVHVEAVDRVGGRAPRPASESQSANVPVASSNPSEGMPQYLYIDAALLQRQSPKRLIDLFIDRLPTILEIGPLTVIVADPYPRTVGSGSDARAIAAALKELRKRLQGSESLLALRRDTLRQMREDPGRTMLAKFALQEELHTLRDRWRRLQEWAMSPAVRHPGILYLGNDGFDLDVADLYAGMLPFREAVELRTEFATQVSVMTAGVARELAGIGLITNPVVMGSGVVEFAGSASDVGTVKLEQMTSAGRAPTFLFSRPLDGLRLIGDTTGGRLVTENKFGDALNAVENLYRVFYKSDLPPTGPPRGIEVRSTDQSLILRSPKYSISENPDAVAAQRADSLLQGDAVPVDAGLKVEVRVSDVSVGKKRRSGRLRVTANLGPILAALQRAGAPHVRITIVVEVKDSEPFVTHQEMDVAQSDSGALWEFDAPLEWPQDAKRIAVTVEELRTGTYGVGAATLPTS